MVCKANAVLDQPTQSWTSPNQAPQHIMQRSRLQLLCFIVFLYGRWQYVLTDGCTGVTLCPRHTPGNSCKQFASVVCGHNAEQVNSTMVSCSVYLGGSLVQKGASVVKALSDQQPDFIVCACSCLLYGTGPFVAVHGQQASR